MSSRQIIKEPKPKIETAVPKNFLMKPVPLYILALIFLPLLSLGYFLHQPKKIGGNISPEVIKDSGNYDACATIIRQKDSSLIRPLLFVEINSEQNLVQIEADIDNYILKKKQEGIINSASVYLNDLNTANHFEINANELYDPASLMKVPMLIIYLKEAENNPGLLKKRYLFSNSQKRNYAATIKDKTLTEGNNYSVEDLLYYMIVYSDNQAFWLLADNINNNKFELLNQDFDIPKNISNKDQDKKFQSFIANVNSLSRFFRVLYSSTYLNRNMSTYALKLLTKSTYKDGIMKGIDPNIKVAHKFGERVEGGVAEFHEFGIVYLKNNPYLIGVMTKGKNLNQLEGVVGDISKIAFDEMKNKL